MNADDVQLTERERELVARWLERNPDKAGLDEVRLKEYGIAVWALAGGLRREGDAALEQIARSYDVPQEAIAAVVLELAEYYHHESP